MKKLRNKIAIETLNYIKKYSWEKITVQKISLHFKKDKKKFLNLIHNENDLLSNIIIYFDNKILDSENSIDQSSKKDMIFEIFMMRFDFLNNHRLSILKIFNMLKKNPDKLIFLLPLFIQSIKIMLDLAKIKYNKLSGSLKINIFLVIYFSTFLIWIKDESDSLDKTMITLDNYLTKADNIMKLIKN